MTCIVAGGRWMAADRRITNDDGGSSSLVKIAKSPWLIAAALPWAGSRLCRSTAAPGLTRTSRSGGPSGSSAESERIVAEGLTSGDPGRMSRDPLSHDRRLGDSYPRACVKGSHDSGTQALSLFS